MSRVLLPPRSCRSRPPASEPIFLARGPSAALGRWLIAACLVALLCLSIVVTWAFAGGNAPAGGTTVAAVEPAPVEPALEGKPSAPPAAPVEPGPLSPIEPLPSFPESGWERLDIKPTLALRASFPAVPSEPAPFGGLTAPKPAAPDVTPPAPKSVDPAPLDPRLVGCTKLGTKIAFYKDPPDAFAAAREERKLVFFITLSGNFEDKEFT
jgi:hypothetical protein